MTSNKHFQVVVLGSGPAGYTAGVYAARANLNVAIITGMEFGGQLMTTTEVENWPGDSKDLTGPKLMERLHEHAQEVNCHIIRDHINAADISKRPFELTGDFGTYTADALIISTGASAQYLGLESEKKFLGRGVSACATCDGFFFKDQEVAVVGGGNTALTEALYLANIASHVHVIHRRDAFRGEKVLQERVKNHDKITIHWHHELNEVLGDNAGVNAIEIKHNQTQALTKLALQGVFIAIGHKPNTDLFKEQLDLDGGYICIHSGQNGNATATSVPGVFAAGDVSDSIYRQAITSAGSGCMAALDAEKFLEMERHQ